MVEPSPRDAAAAAMASIVAALGGERLSLDAAFQPVALMRWTERWLAELNGAGGARIVASFRERAG